MKCHRVSYFATDMEHVGYTFHSSKRDAVREATETRRRCNCTTELDVVEWDHSRAGVIALLNRVAEHPNNG